jgi:undecaprenyl-diphosphatase
VFPDRLRGLTAAPGASDWLARPRVAPPWRHWLLAVTAVMLLAMALLDRPVVLTMLALRSGNPAFNDWMLRATFLGDSSWMLVVTAIMAAYPTWLMVRRRSPLLRRGLATVRDIALTAFAAVALTGSLAAFLKLAIGRPRPTMIDELGAFGFQPLAFDFKINSLPSGHATTLFALVTIVALVVPRWRWHLFALAGLGGLTRVAVGAHFVSDIIAGSAVGYAGAIGLATLAAQQGRGFDQALRPLAPRAARAAFVVVFRQALCEMGRGSTAVGKRFHEIARPRKP